MLKRKGILIHLLFLTAAANATFSPPVRLNRSIDQLLFRIASRHGIELPYTLFSQPMQTESVLRFLEKVDSLGGVGLLSVEEQAVAAQLRTQLEGGTTRLKWRDTEKDLSVFANLRLRGKVENHLEPENALHVRGVINPILQGNIAALSYYAEIDVWTEYRSDTLYPMSSFQPHDGVPYTLYARAHESHFRASDLPRGGVLYTGKLVSCATGIDYLREGPAIYNPVTLADGIPPITFARAWMDLGVAKYIHTVGMLKFQKDKPKYIYLHRLHIPLFANRATVGVSEVIVNGSTVDYLEEKIREEYVGEERALEWTYLIPFVPFKFTEHYNGDRDNAGVSLDFNVLWPRTFRWYGELFIDDMLSPVQFWTDDWGNKLAFTVGAQHFGKLWEKDITTTAEYCRVEPWVYTHFYGGGHRYSHYNKPLGSQLGPNAHQLNTALTMQISPHVNAGLNYQYTGSNPSARGGSVNHIYQDFVDSERKTFLGPGSTSAHLCGLTWDHNPLGRIWIDGLVGYHSRDKFVLRTSGGVLF